MVANIWICSRWPFRMKNLCDAGPEGPRQIGSRIMGPIEWAPESGAPDSWALDSWAPERCWSPTVGIESRMFNCKHILEIMTSTPQTTIKLDNSPKCLAQKSG